jgi:pimeloyl-ACP methyl ester carboxylesterase
MVIFPGGCLVRALSADPFIATAAWYTCAMGKGLALGCVLAGTLMAAPCTTATADCTEKVPVGDNGKWGLAYRTVPLTAKNDAVRRAFVLIHGMNRNADGYFRTAVAAALLGGALEDTIVISPRFASNDGRSCRDPLGEGEVSWTCQGDNWSGGGPAADDAGLYSFDFIDSLLKRIAKKDVFPNLKVIVVAGHSAGGQFVNRYAASNKVDGTLGVPLHYVVSNPSSYMYLDALRPAADMACTAKGCTGSFGAYRDARNCTTYNRWRYGLEDKRGYVAQRTDDELKSLSAARDVTYLLGDQDQYPLAGFDSSCPAMAQGPTRFARGLAYWNYVNTNHHAKHKLVVVELCGHNARCMFTAEPALAVTFPKR